MDRVNLLIYFTSENLSLVEVSLQARSCNEMGFPSFFNYRSQIDFFNNNKVTFTLKLFQKVAEKYARKYHFYGTFSTEFECNFYKKFWS